MDTSNSDVTRCADNCVLSSCTHLVSSEKLTDMGLACAVTATKSRKSRSMAGTPMYMAPEVIAGETYSARADVFSLGMVLFELSCGGAYTFKSASAEQDEAMFAKLEDGRGKVLALKALRRKQEDRLSSYELFKLAQIVAREPAARFTRGNFFVYVSIASPPFLLANGLAFAKQFKEIEIRLRDEQDT